MLVKFCKNWDVFPWRLVLPYIVKDIWVYPAAQPGFRFGRGDILRARTRKGSGGPSPPPGRQKTWKVAKKFLKKIAKMDYLRDISKKVKKTRFKFSRFRRKTHLFGKVLRKISKISRKKFQWNFFCKNPLFWSIFKITSKPCVRFSPVLTKNTIGW